MVAVFLWLNAIDLHTRRHHREAPPSTRHCRTDLHYCCHSPGLPGRAPSPPPLCDPVVCLPGGVPSFFASAFSIPLAPRHYHWRTLIVPATLFRCKKCKRAGDRPYLAIIADGHHR